MKIRDVKMSYATFTQLVISGAGAGAAFWEGRFVLAGLFSALFLLSMLAWLVERTTASACLEDQNNG